MANQPGDAVSSWRVLTSTETDDADPYSTTVASHDAPSVDGWMQPGPGSERAEGGTQGSRVRGWGRRERAPAQRTVHRGPERVAGRHADHHRSARPPARDGVHPIVCPIVPCRVGAPARCAD